MELTQETRKKFLGIKEETSKLLGAINSVYSNLKLERYEVEWLYYVYFLIDDILLDKINPKKTNKEAFIMIRLIEIEMMLSASNKKPLKELVKKIKRINL